MAYDTQRDFKNTGLDFSAALQITPNDSGLYYYRSILNNYAPLSASFFLSISSNFVVVFQLRMVMD